MDPATAYSAATSFAHLNCFAFFQLELIQRFRFRAQHRRESPQCAGAVHTAGGENGGIRSEARNSGRKAERRGNGIADQRRKEWNRQQLAASTPKRWTPTPEADYERTVRTELLKSAAIPEAKNQRSNSSPAFRGNSRRERKRPG